MRVVLAGTRSFGSAVLACLLEHGHKVELVVAPRGDTLYNVSRWDCTLPTVTDLDYRDVEAIRPDIIVGAHMHQFIGARSRAAAAEGALIGHPSLLPRHRGRSSVEWTIRMGDPIAGFTWFEADSGIDTGHIAWQDWCHVRPGWTASDLWRERLFDMGVNGLEPALNATRADQVWPQDPKVATWEPALDNVPRLHRTELQQLPPGRSIR